MEKFNWKTVGLKRVIKLGPKIRKSVFEGMFQSKPVAVKSVIFDQKEAEILRKLDHPNIIRIHFVDAKDSMLYLVLTYCKYTLQDYVEKKTEINLNRIEVLRQITCGLEYLHHGQKFCTVHRDLKPSNILFEEVHREETWIVKISDFGISKEFVAGKTSTYSELRGSEGYMAPELLVRADGSRGLGKIRRETDMFSFGVIFYYVLSDGKHPFTNDALQYNKKIRDEQPVLDDLLEEYSYDAKFIISSMICKDYKNRFNISMVKIHHLFWDADMKIEFFQRASDVLEDRDKQKSLLAELERMCEEVTCGIWKDRICNDDLSQEIKRVIEKRKGWENRKSLQDLLRQIRNWIHHYHDPATTDKLKKVLGSFPDGIIRFFTWYFPKLLPRVYQLMYKLKDHERLRKFYAAEAVKADHEVEECSVTVEDDVSQGNSATLANDGLHDKEVLVMSDDGEDMEDDENWGDLGAMAPNQEVQKSGSDKDFTLVLREYQKELSEQAVLGHNSLIIAPTGSGKTAVANEIIKSHLKSGDSKSIFFFVSKTTLARQQYDFFSRHLSEHLDVMDIAYLIGEMTTNVAVGVIMQKTKLIILTPQILIDELSRTRPYISFDDISMMIFDECHNATGKHPYKVVMDMFIDFRFRNPTCRLVQVIGMTASPGVGNGKTREKVLENLITLLASLNVTLKPAVVERNVNELEQYKNKIEASFVRVKIVQDDFTSVICNAISLIEDQVIGSGVIGFEAGQIPKPPAEKEKQKYQNWVVDLGNYARLKEDNHKLSRSLSLFARHLKMYHNLLYLKNLIPHAIDIVACEVNVDQEEEEGRNLLELLFQVSKCSKNSDVPLLRELLKTLREEFRQDRTSRCIIFVPRRVIAPALVDAINLTDDLSYLEPKSLTGSNEHVEHGGMTKNEQDDALKAFRLGESKLLIATSVAEEGIDIPACNLVIMYNYVTGEVGKIQRAGRGRAENSRSILIASCGSEHFQIERRNEICAQATNIAIKDLNGLTAEERERRITNVQRREMEGRQRQHAEEERRLLDAKKWRVLCGHCRAELTRGDRIRHIKNQHRFVVDESFFDHVNRHPCEPQPMAPGQPYERVAHYSCRICRNRIGVDMRYREAQFPTLSIKQLVFEDDHMQRRGAKQWSKCPFAVEKSLEDIGPQVDLQAIEQFILGQRKAVVTGFAAEEADEEDTMEAVAMANIITAS